MKKRIFLKAVVLGIAILFLAAPGAMGYEVGVTRIPGYYESSFNGGEFTLTPSPDFSWVLSGYDSAALSYFGSAFQSFCVERDEYVMGETPSIYDATYEDQANAGGVNTNSGDFVSLGTAWLYSNFALGFLDNYGYDYTVGSARATSAYYLQYALWYLEDELVATGNPSSPIDTLLGNPLSNPFLSVVNTRFGSLTNAKVDNYNTTTGIRTYGVYALNLTYDGINKQSQLVFVPEPSTLLLLGAALLGVAGLKRRMKK